MSQIISHRRVIQRLFLLVSFIALAVAISTGVFFSQEEEATVIPNRFGPELSADPDTGNTARSENLQKVLEFVETLQYRVWEHDPYIRPTGDIHSTPDGKVIDGSTHHRVRIYYSPDVVKWLKKCRNTLHKPGKGECTPEKNMRALPDGSTMVKEMYQSVPPVYPAEDPLIGWAVMVKKNGASPDGWFWTIHFKQAFRSMATMGAFSYSFCLACHGTTTGQSSFASYQNLTGDNARSMDGKNFKTLADPVFMKRILTERISATGDIKPHRESPDPAFQRLYSDTSIYQGEAAPVYRASGTGPIFPDSDYDHVWNHVSPMPASHSYLTSSNCIGCHDATSLVGT